MNEQLLKYEEKVLFNLRDLYRKHGYLPYQMSKFEEYELYIRNKEFMVSDRVIAFNDTNGKMMALKPDVTLSIIKSGEDVAGVKQKVYYNENVYRVSQSTHRFKEIMQAGLECIGDTDLYDIFEVISLAAQSLASIRENFVLTVSHLGILNTVVDSLCEDGRFKKQAFDFISEKNEHDLKRLCEEFGIEENGYSTLCRLIHAYGERSSVLESLKTIPAVGNTEELEQLSALLDTSPYSKQIQFDFSLVSDNNYYNGFIFKGFLYGIANDILSGGQYDKMMEKMHRRSHAVGFALYLDTLEQLAPTKQGYDVDFLVLYDATVPCAVVAEKTADLIAKGFTCSAQKGKPDKLRCKEIIDLRKEG
ncbi:MAG TPA: hypothetical protein DDY98_03660 [Ruminococcaceae bacterium]|nr:hypothetical protein [Oscillospiraceae bacterium]